MFEGLSEVFINAFAKPKQVDHQVQEIRSQLGTFQEHVTSADKLHAKLVKLRRDVAFDTAAFGDAMISLGLMETDVKEPLTAFGQGLTDLAELDREKVNTSNT